MLYNECECESAPHVRAPKLNIENLKKGVRREGRKRGTHARTQR